MSAEWGLWPKAKQSHRSDHRNVTKPARTHPNESPMKKLTHILVTLTFGFSCFGLWAMLHLFSTVPTRSHALPAFTSFVIGLRTWLLLLPIPVVAYCVYALIRRPAAEQNGTAFPVESSAPMISAGVSPGGSGPAARTARVLIAPLRPSARQPRRAVRRS